MIKCAFGCLKARWKMLLRPMDNPVEKLSNIIYACFVLHNLCEETKGEEDANFVEKRQEERHAKLSVNKLSSCTSTSIFTNNYYTDLRQDFCPDIQCMLLKF